jgi:hypothetical protein
MAASMLSILEPLAAHARSWVLPGNESWFYFSYDYERKRAFGRDLSMMKPKAWINARKIIVLVISGVDGTALVELVPLNLRLSAKYVCEVAIRHLEVSMKAYSPKQGLKGITFHWDNRPSHTSK